MTYRLTGLAPWLLTAALMGSTASKAAASSEVPTHTPPRLALLEGDVSFWRPSLGDWQKAPVNLPLAEGDVVATGQSSRAELQLRRGVYLRVGSESELQLVEQTDSRYRFELGRGVVALDVRASVAGDLIEIVLGDVEMRPLRQGFYRVERREQQARVITRRGARAWLARGYAQRELASDLELTLDLSKPGTLPVAGLAPPPDDWDQWNFHRSAQLVRERGRLFASDLAGVEELEAYGEWRTVPAYGLVWFPRVPRVWAPYSTGRWIWDPVYGWTWIDFAPWGWVPFHYGRWVWVDGSWGWVLGPPGPRYVYAPALVAFFVGKGFFVGVASRPAFVAWAPLGWGEPCLPWWGPAWFVGKPWWGGWHGPRRRLAGEDQEVGRHGADALQKDDFEHVRARRGLRGIRSDRFGLFPVTTARTEPVQIDRLALPHRDLPRRPGSRTPEAGELGTVPDGRDLPKQRSDVKRKPFPSAKDAPERRPAPAPELSGDIGRVPRRPSRSAAGAWSAPGTAGDTPLQPSPERWGPFAPNIQRGDVGERLDEGLGVQRKRVDPRGFARDRAPLPRGVSGAGTFDESSRGQHPRGPFERPGLPAGQPTLPERVSAFPKVGIRRQPPIHFPPPLPVTERGRNPEDLVPRRPFHPITSEAVQAPSGLGSMAEGSDAAPSSPERRRRFPFPSERGAVHRSR